MNIYFVQRTDEIGYDEFDSFIIVAKSILDAAYTHPEESDFNNPRYIVDENGNWLKRNIWTNEYKHPIYNSWASIRNIEVLEIGTPSKDENYKQIICTSFNAG